MHERQISKAILELALNRHKMGFVSGPRQCGKTTLSKNLLLNPALYFSWDTLKFRQQWIKDSHEIATLALQDQTPRVVFDELHKNRRWKSQLKGFFDEYGNKIEILVTGSARFNVYRKGGDSLLGRFYHFHLHPFSLSEYLKNSTIELEDFDGLIHSFEPFSLKKKNTDGVDALLRWGGFPEPLLAAQDSIHRLWQQNRLELLIRQDLRELSRINEISQVEILASLLPLKVGSPLSIQSLREDIEVAFTTVKRWLGFLEALYYHFEIKPYSKSITRSLKKEGKIYLYDWSSVESSGARFENMVASHLLKMSDHWTDTGAAKIELFYLRNKEKKEVDFVLIKNKKPWFTVEAKNNDLNLDSTYQVFQKQLKVPHFQIVQTPNISRSFNTETGKAHVVSFESFFSRLP